MSLSRRDFVRLAGAIAGAAAASSACAPLAGELTGAYRAPGGWTELAPADYRGLARLTYGPIEPETSFVAEHGLAAWIEEQLGLEITDDLPAEGLLRRFDLLRMQADQLEGWEPEEVLGQLRAASLQRQLYSRRQLHERLIEFWTDHFNISVDKGECWFLKVVDDRQVIRAHAQGRFADLLHASAKSPAMLVYLDNQVNEASAPNENYAREVMELHTLGVDGGYSQRDVMELARCLTGWTVKDHFWKGQFAFEPDLHDKGSKQVLGMAIEQAGVVEAERVLDELGAHPATAEHLATKLVRRFVTDHPLEDAPEAVLAVSRTFLQAGGHLPSVYRTLLLDGLVPQLDQLPPKIKRPVDFITSALRPLAAHSDGGASLHDHLALMGQPTFAWPTPDGPPDTADPWSGNLLPRWQFALELAQDEVDGTSIDIDALVEQAQRDEGHIADSLSQRLVGSPAGRGMQSALGQIRRQTDELDPQDMARLLVAGLIGSPQFQWR